MVVVLSRPRPPRPSFAADKGEAERAAMGAHATSLSDLTERGQAVGFGLVADPAGPWGTALLDVTHEAESRALAGADPALRAGIGLRYEILPMPMASARPTRQEQARQTTERTP